MGKKIITALTVASLIPFFISWLLAANELLTPYTAMAKEYLLVPASLSALWYAAVHFAGNSLALRIISYAAAAIVSIGFLLVYFADILPFTLPWHG